MEIRYKPAASGHDIYRQSGQGSAEAILTERLLLLWIFIGSLCGKSPIEIETRVPTGMQLEILAFEINHCEHQHDRNERQTIPDREPGRAILFISTPPRRIRIRFWLIFVGIT